MKAGVDKVADAVRVTLGPRGRAVVIDSGGPRFTLDGVTGSYSDHGKLYGKNDAGAETEFGSGGSLTDHTHAVTGSGATGGGATLNPVTLDVSGASEFSAAWRLTGIITPSIGANQNNWAPTGITTCSLIQLTQTGAGRTITGIDATGFTEGHLLLFSITGGFNLTLAHGSASSSSGNRFGCPNSADLTVRNGGGTIVMYMPTGFSANPWRVVSEV